MLPRIRVEVRCPLTGEIRQEEESMGSRRDRSGALEQGRRLDAIG
ncbi:MAG: hypothetical protein R2845_02700 [Thermomicrobiales bacterium]